MSTYTLDILLNAGIVYIKNDRYFGIVFDGRHIPIGNVGDETEIEKYLAELLSPNRW